jgi:hypothetical protein
MKSSLKKPFKSRIGQCCSVIEPASEEEFTFWFERLRSKAVKGGCRNRVLVK